jgi:SAM-dependent methyltransferase
MASGSLEQRLRPWTVPSRVAVYGFLQGWIDDGERVALNSIADEVRGQPALDVGVGAGRTSWLMRLLTDDYVAIDWSPQMVSLCRSSCPGVDVRQGDARDLSEFPSSHFKLVFFSYNGIDSVGHSDRSRVYEAVSRVLMPGGIFVYSTISKDGYLFRQRPWFHGPGRPTLQRIGGTIIHAPERLRNAPTRYLNWWKNHRVSEDHGDWGMAPMAAVDFNMFHFTTVDAEKKALAEHGFVVSDTLAKTGERISDNAGDSPWFFVIARLGR